MLIHRMALQEQERNVTRARISSLLITYRKGSMNKDEVNRYFTEWQEVAVRVRKGAEMLDTTTAVQERSKQHLKELSDLYDLLMKVLGMYDMFFKRMFQDTPERYERANRKILDMLQ